MVPTIEISQKIYNKLEKIATGFDTPENVIEKLIKAYVPNQKIKTYISNDKFIHKDKIQKWANKPKQGNTQIVKLYMSLAPDNSGTDIDEFKHEIQKQKIYKGDGFKIQNNLNSMQTDSGNAHGRVFYKEGSNFYIHGEIYEEICKYFK